MQEIEGDLCLKLVVVVVVDEPDESCLRCETCVA